MKRLLMLAIVCAVIAAVAMPAVGSARDKTHKRDRTTHRDRRSGSETSNRLCGLDTEYLKDSMEGELFEIDGARIAQQTSTNPAVLRLAAQLIKDHSKSYATAVALARKLGVQVQTEPSPSEQWELQALRQFKGSQFDFQYADLEVFDHMQDIDLATHEAGDGCAFVVTDNARDELPMLRMHLALAEETLKQVS
jgi:putative membrane protein